MPASGGDPVSAALRLSLSANDEQNDNIDKRLAAASSRVLLTKINYEQAGSYQSKILDNLKNKYILLKSRTNDNLTNRPRPKFIGPELPTAEHTESTMNTKLKSDAVLPTPTMHLFPAESIQLGWRGTFPVGVGLINVGNTCYLNATLQALFHVPALVNWLLSDTAHLNKCTQTNGMIHGECIICAMAKTLKASHTKNFNYIKPYLITQKLKLICKHMNHGCQEDAHEFMRYLIESMEKCFLTRFKGHKLDNYTKETTPLNHIFGGYMRTEVKCLACSSVSTTFQHFQDLLLDIRRASSLDDALTAYFSRERLDEGAYLCSNCKKKVNATKKFSIEKPPRVLCAQLKRFSVMQQKLSKQISIPQRVDLARFICPDSPVAGRGPFWYRFVAMVNHLGSSIGCGHYTAVARTAAGQLYHFDDTNVRPVSAQSLPDTNAYVIIYELEREVPLNSNQNVQKVTLSKVSPAMNHGPSTSTNYRPLFSLIPTNKISPSLIPTNPKPAVITAYQKPNSSPMSSNHLGLLAPTSSGNYKATSTITTLPPPNNRDRVAFSFQPKTNGLVPYDSDDSDNETPLPTPDIHKKRKAMPVNGNGSLLHCATPATSTNSPSKSVNGDTSVAKSWHVTDASGAGWAVSDVETNDDEDSTKTENGETKQGKEKKAKTKREHTNVSGEEESRSNKLFVRNGDNCNDEKGNSLHQTQSPLNGKGNSNIHSFRMPESNHSSAKEYPNKRSESETWQEKSSSREPTNGNPGSIKTNGFNHNYNTSYAVGVPLSRKEPSAGHFPTQNNAPLNGHTSYNGRNGESNPPRWNNGNSVHHLQRMSHQGYGSAVNSWTGGKSHVDRAVDSDRREDRKRNYERGYDEDMDRGRSKKVKRHHDYNKPHFNRFQSCQEDQYRWNGHPGKMFYNKTHGHKHKQRFSHHRDNWRH